MFNLNMFLNLIYLLIWIGIIYLITGWWVHLVCKIHNYFESEKDEEFEFKPPTPMEWEAPDNYEPEVYTLTFDNEEYFEIRDGKYRHYGINQSKVQEDSKRHRCNNCLEPQIELKDEDLNNDEFIPIIGRRNPIRLSKR